MNDATKNTNPPTAVNASGIGCSGRFGSTIVEAEGLTHLINPAMGNEFTLCGDAFDLGADEPGYHWKNTRRRAVTCPKCAEIIRACRGVRIGKPNVKGEP